MTANRVKIFAFVKNEQYMMSAWIPYHAALVGMANLHIIDHNSEPDCQRFYEQYIALGLEVRVVNCSFREKGRQLTKWMQELRTESDLLIALDADEFIAYRNGNSSPICDPVVVRSQLETLELGPHKYSFCIQKVANNQFEYNDPLTEMTGFGGVSMRLGAKTFWPAKTFIETDEGNHRGRVEGENNKYVRTDIVLIHFTYRGYYHFADKCIRSRDHLRFDEKFVGIAVEWRAGWNEIISGTSEASFRATLCHLPANLVFGNRIRELREREAAEGRIVLDSEKWERTKLRLIELKNTPNLKRAALPPPKK